MPVTINGSDGITNASWTWNSSDKVWEAPEPRPDDGNDYTWDEETTSWVVAETNETES